MDENVLQNRRRIGRELRERRTEQGWSREQVAMMAGVTERTIEKIEEGAFNVPLDILGKVADVIGYELMIKPKKNS